MFTFKRIAEEEKEQHIRFKGCVCVNSRDLEEIKNK